MLCVGTNCSTSQRNLQCLQPTKLNPPHKRLEFSHTQRKEQEIVLFPPTNRNKRVKMTILCVQCVFQHKKAQQEGCCIICFIQKCFALCEKIVEALMMIQLKSWLMSLMYIVIWVYGESPTCRLRRPQVSYRMSLLSTGWRSKRCEPLALDVWLSWTSNFNQITGGIIHNCFIDSGEKGTGCGDGKFMLTEKTTLANVSQLQVAFCYSITCIQTFNHWMFKPFMFYYICLGLVND